MTTTFTDLPIRTRSRSHGAVRTIFAHLLDVHDRHVRRYPAATIPHLGSDRLDLSQIESRSLFDTASLERR